MSTSQSVVSTAVSRNSTHLIAERDTLYWILGRAWFGPNEKPRDVWSAFNMDSIVQEVESVIYYRIDCALKAYVTLSTTGELPSSEFDHWCFGIVAEMCLFESIYGLAVIAGYQVMCPAACMEVLNTFFCHSQPPKRNWEQLYVQYCASYDASAVYKGLRWAGMPRWWMCDEGEIEAGIIQFLDYTGIEPNYIADRLQATENRYLLNMGLRPLGVKHFFLPCVAHFKNMGPVDQDDPTRAMDLVVAKARRLVSLSSEYECEPTLPSDFLGHLTKYSADPRLSWFGDGLLVDNIRDLYSQQYQSLAKIQDRYAEKVVALAIALEAYESNTTYDPVVYRPSL
ncbi:hypothetical protein JAAARDRAFT_189946 [Jaapia argillacea MUCL 33604]|uniref:Uncharacterized protein n=1 Tax=Jaapia argillacea MUCL 33604 TaxID=933084 RepID=A0A067QJ49_9AGAM|nr:hypothetical protein JAAARDRAFT_189946 [Jaapia argillacea MUCL 33604]